jgi:WD40 repeat protein
VTLFTVIWLSLVTRSVVLQIRASGRASWAVGLMGLLVLVGGGGFFGTILLAIGVLKPSNTFQWPPGYVTGIVRTPDGKYVVPLVPVGRVQLYDPQWRFLRGWDVDANAGSFKIACASNGTIEVFAARGLHQYSFAQDGTLISVSSLPTDFDLDASDGLSMVVPTSPLLWIFSSPFLLWGLAAIGMLGLQALKVIHRQKGRDSV